MHPCLCSVFADFRPDTEISMATKIPSYNPCANDPYGASSMPIYQVRCLTLPPASPGIPMFFVDTLHDKNRLYSLCRESYTIFDVLCIDIVCMISIFTPDTDVNLFARRPCFIVM